jgi:hypothetical protein
LPSSASIPTRDNEDIVGHYLSVASDPDTWAMLLPGEDQHGKALKNYHPANPRGDTIGADPLAHPKVEISLSNEYDPDGSVSWSDLEEFRDELDERMLNVLSWAGVPPAPDAGVWVAEDPHFDVVAREGDVEIVSNPLPELCEAAAEHVESELVRTEMSPAQEEVLTVLTDGGQQHYETVAEEADVGTSTVYRLVDKLPSLIESENGLLDFADDVTRRHVKGIVDRSARRPTGPHSLSGRSPRSTTSSVPTTGRSRSGWIATGSGWFVSIPSWSSRSIGPWVRRRSASCSGPASTLPRRPGC